MWSAKAYQGLSCNARTADSERDLITVARRAFLPMPVVAKAPTTSAPAREPRLCKIACTLACASRVSRETAGLLRGEYVTPRTEKRQTLAEQVGKAT